MQIIEHRILQIPLETGASSNTPKQTVQRRHAMTGPVKTDTTNPADIKINAEDKHHASINIKVIQMKLWQ